MKKIQSDKKPDGKDIEKLRRRLQERISENDVSLEEEFDNSDYFETIPGWIKQIGDRFRYLARQIGRARLPGPDHGDLERIEMLWRIMEQADKVYRVFKYTEGMSDGQIAKLFDNYFSGLEIRAKKMYFERIKGAKSVYSGISAREMDSIADGRWIETLPEKGRKWMDVTVNKAVAREFALCNMISGGAGVLIEIDMDSIRDRIISPGYVARTVFAQPQDDINAPDSLMRGMINEEHHLPPDTDLRKARMRITIIGLSPSQRELYKEKFENLNIKNWLINFE